MVWMWLKSVPLSRPGAVLVVGVATSAVAYGIYKFLGSLFVDDDEYFERLINKTEDQQKKRILVVGLDKSGKTCFVRCLGKGNKHDPAPRPTVGFNVKSISLGEFTFDIWDLGGSELCRGYWKEFVNNIDVIVWCVDSADIDRMSESAQVLQNFVQRDVAPGIPILIVATKQDLATSLQPNQIMQKMELSQKLKEEHNFDCVGIQVPIEGVRKGMWAAYKKLTDMKANTGGQ